MLIEYLVSAVVLGIVVAIPPGSVTIVACQRALQCGFRNSLMFTFGSCLSDIFYILLVYYGIAGIISGNHTYKILLWTVCGIILIIIGALSLISARNTQNTKTAAFQSNFFTTFFSGILITLTNPMTIVGWIGIAGNFFLIWNERFPYSKNIGIISILLIMAGVLLWFIPLTFIVSRLRKVINRRLKTYLIIISGICLIIFGILGLYYSIMTIWG
jgi:L-lysine exporter family protein LysE/ArgO